MTDPRLTALSPLDGRYAAQTAELAALFSEAALIRYRIRVEALWLLHLAAEPSIRELAGLAASAVAELELLAREPGEQAVPAVKKIEAGTHHDVKAVEYYLRERLSAAGAAPAHLEFVHFACTSEDVNNLCYAMMLSDARRGVLLPLMSGLHDQLRALVRSTAALPMLSRTHGQPASPTTLGKEVANFLVRLERLAAGLSAVEILGKFNGAVGNYNAHVIAYPETDWLAITARFVESLGFRPNAYTVQIEPHDWIAEYCHALARYQTALTDLCRDFWGYIALGYFRQRAVGGEVGSSTMPHKVNPIAFENAEGNAGLANALLGFLADKLPVSRWQRDLSDSTVLRNVGVAIGHAVLAIKSTGRGLDSIEADPRRLAADLDGNWEVLAEAVQTVMRRHGMPDAYERLKEFTRGRRVTGKELRAYVQGLGLPEEATQRLADLTPGDYTGLAAQLAREA